MDKDWTKEFGEFLKQKGILPLENWRTTRIKHVTPINISEQKAIENELKLFCSENGELLSGLYAYESDGKILYIGKGHPIFNRLKSHYRESFTLDYPERFKHWYDYFRLNQRELTIRILPVARENDRVIIEKILTEVLDPDFERFRKEGING